ncbi:MAG: hypothetical protein JW727_01310 [Candidatus Aenigmarchaeota archaeon]|nr:hypothetical protein [Candidatus Aenigmarchaeota archaeon]
MVELAFKTIAELIVALFAVAFFLLIIEGMLPGATGNTFCGIGNAISALPIPHHLKPSLDQCGLKHTSARQELQYPLDDATLLQYAEECWENNDEGMGGMTYTCYELFVWEVSGTITEETFTSLLEERGLCDTIPNNFLDVEKSGTDCGASNRLLWKIGDISGEEVTIIVKYNAFDHRLEII